VDHNSAASPRSRLASDRDLDILIQGGKKVHQAFYGESFELVVAERRNFRLVYAQLASRLRLRPAAALDQFINRAG